MYVLGIETSCDETAASIVKDGKTILSNVVISSLKEHSRYGGIIPEIASRRQLECINPIVEESLKRANLKFRDINRLAVTTTPGLIGSLLVGISFARALSYSLKTPLIEVDHIKSHLYANFLVDPKTDKQNVKLPKLPAVGLIVSGGHTSLYHIKDFQSFKLIGKTLDDAAGEAFDKVARILNLGYPGGPVIDKLARGCTQTKTQFKCAELKNTFDFSFSGIKAAVLYHIKNYPQMTETDKIQIAHDFQESIVENLTQKCFAACKQLHSKTLLVGGGVAANSRLRERLLEEGRQRKIKVYFPSLQLCLDNAAMIAGYAFHHQS